MAKVVGFNKKLIRRVSCYECAAKVEYTLNEVQENNYTDYGGGPAGSKWIICPNCGKRIVLESW